MKSIVVLLLAAGSSSRLGQPKQQLSVAGKPLLRLMAEEALATKASQTIIVLGYQDQLHRDILSGLPITIVVNSSWKNGMGSSIKTGIRFLAQEHTVDGILIMVCDQPKVTAHHLNALINSFQETSSDIVASAYADTWGVPAIFSAQLIPELLSIEDKQGAKPVIEKYKAVGTAIPFPEGAIDLDTPGDVKRFELKND